jgi:hypothetical protein
MVILHFGFSNWIGTSNWTTWCFSIIFRTKIIDFGGTSWCSGRLIGSPRQRSRVQDPISTINIHEGSHWISEPYTLWGSHALTNSIEFRHAKDVKTIELRLWINLNLDPSDKPRRHKKDVKWILILILIDLL